MGLIFQGFSRFWQEYRGEILFLAGVLLVSGSLMAWMLNPYLTVVNLDSAIFCLLGKSLAQGQGYLLTSEPNPQPYFTFPPLLPLQLAALTTLFPKADDQTLQLVFKGSIQLMFLLSLPVFYLWIRQGLGKGPAVVLTALMAINPIVFKYSSDVLSDVPFWFFSITALWLVGLWASRAEQKPGKATLFLAAVLFIILAALCRQIGVALAISFLGFLALHRHWRALLVSGTLFALLIGGWQGFEHAYRLNHPVEADGLNQAGVNAFLSKSPVKLEFIKHFLVVNPVSNDAAKTVQGPSQVVQNAMVRLERYTQISLDQISPPVTLKVAGKKQNLFHSFPFLAVFWIVFALGLKEAHKRFTLFAPYLLLYGGILLVYPYISPRFLLPVFPLILVCVYLGLFKVKDALESRLNARSDAPPDATPKSRLRWATAVLVPGFLLLTFAGGHLPQTLRWVNAGHKIKKAHEAPSLKPENKGFYQSLVWLKGNVPQNSLVISRKPPVTYYYSGRKSIPFPFTEKTDTLYGEIRAKAAQYGKNLPHVYLVEDTAFGETSRYLTPVFQKYAQHFTLVYTNPLSGSRIWQLNSQN